MIIRWTTEQGITQAFEFDATPTITFGRSGLLTEHVLADRSVVNDHFIPGAARIQCDAWVSDTPLRPMSPLAREVPGSLTLRTYTRRKVKDATITGGPGYTIPVPGQIVVGGSKPVVSPTTYQDVPEIVVATPKVFLVTVARIREALDVLDALMDERQVVTVVNGLRDFRRCMLVEYALPYTLAGGANLSLTFQQFRVGSLTVTDLPEPAEPRGQAKSNKGPQQGYTLSEQETSAAQALLDQL